jgi:hypothetical protein
MDKQNGRLKAVKERSVSLTVSHLKYYLNDEIELGPSWENLILDCFIFSEEFVFLYFRYDSPNFSYVSKLKVTSFQLLSVLRFYISRITPV